MANTKISALTTDSAPHRTNDFSPTYDASAVVTKKVALKDYGVIPLVAQCAVSNPADATSYLFGSFPETALTTLTGRKRIYIQRAGIITGADVWIWVDTTAASGETSTMSVRLNNTTDTTISSSITLTTGLDHFTNTALSIAVAVGDYVEIKWASPTWATNPIGVHIAVRLIQE